MGRNIGILCPAQAYPTPVFRYETFFSRLSLLLILHFSNFFFGSRSCRNKIFDVESFCNKFSFNNAEPIGSVSPKIHDGDKSRVMQREQNKAISLLCPAQAYPTPIFRYSYCFNYSRAKFLVFCLNRGWLNVSSVVKSFSILFSEPVGSVSPKIQIGDEFKLIRQKSGEAVNLLCPAQAYPTPVFR